MFIHQILFSVLWAYHYGVEIWVNLSKGAYCWVGNLFTAQACQKSTVHSSTIRTPCRRHQKTTGKIKCTPSSPKKYSATGRSPSNWWAPATGQKNHTRVFLTQKKQNKTKQNNNKKHSCASPHNCSNGPFILGPCSVCLPLGSYEACEPTYHISWSRSLELQ